MDPVTHTLAGMALAATPLGRRSRLAGAALVVGANLPDVDAVLYAFGSPDLALLCRRGWTHGVLALAVLPVLLAGLLLAWDRWRPDPAGGRASPRALLGLSALAVCSHPALDWLNTYGVRILMPFSDRWFYGDALFIVDPWAWLMLGGGVFLARPRGRRSALRWTALALAAGLVLGSRPQVPLAARLLFVAGVVLVALVAVARRGAARPASGLAAGGLAAFAVYAVLLVVTSRVTEERVLRDLGERTDGPVERVMMSPRPANPFVWDALVETARSYSFYRYDWRSRRQAVETDPRIPRQPETPVVAAARAAPWVQGMVAWARFPWYEVEESPDGYTVWILDARYTRSRRQGFGAARVDLGRDLVPRRPR